jgi:hypothetical protein
MWFYLFPLPIIISIMGIPPSTLYVMHGVVLAHLFIYLVVVVVFYIADDIAEIWYPRLTIFFETYHLLDIRWQQMCLLCDHAFSLFFLHLYTTRI